MRVFKALLIASLLCLGSAAQADAGSASISKFLPHYLDHEGRHTLSPSLYERDAYQARLRGNPEMVSGIRFDFKWKASRVDRDKLRVRIEIRGSKTLPGKPFVIESPVKRKGLFGRWSAVTVDKEQFSKVGEMIAWRVSLLEGEAKLAEQRSFLWQAVNEQKAAGTKALD